MSTRIKHEYPKKTLFISWSGIYSKRIAERLKTSLEKIFSNKLTCFVSTKDIASGEDWYDKIKNELAKSSLGILCITKENIKAPWLYFEAGALVGNNLNVIPLLINCDQISLNDTPISANQSIQFYNPEQFKKMLNDIREKLNLLPDTDREILDEIYKTQYNNLKDDLKPQLDKLKSQRYFSERYIYPQDVNTMTMDTIYISAPMSTITSEEYVDQQRFLKRLSDSLQKNEICKTIYCPAIETTVEEWDGITTAVKKNYTKLRQVQHLIVIYPRSMPTSSLVEIGYGIALCKNIIIFYKDKLPFMLNGAAEDIPHLHTRRYRTYQDIIRAINTDRSLFEARKDE
ncbi:MAG: toll/interleukin-1 receptor domain-containing protein [Bacteroidales bacterium]|nr:toll/interleukin-1 receptor domain-containing protein [Bacteroidales bacterium]